MKEQKVKKRGRFTQTELFADGDEAREDAGPGNGAQWVGGSRARAAGVRWPWKVLEEDWHLTKLLRSRILSPQALPLLQANKVPGDTLGYPSPAFFTPVP